MNKFFRSNRKKADEIFELRKTETVSRTSFRQQRSGVEYTSIPVNVQELRDGMMMFSMLLESCLPGSVPDPSIVAGILELVRLYAADNFFLLSVFPQNDVLCFLFWLPRRLLCSCLIIMTINRLVDYNDHKLACLIMIIITLFYYNDYQS